MSFIYAAYNMLHNCIDITSFNGYILRMVLVNKCVGATYKG